MKTNNQQISSLVWTDWEHNPGEYFVAQAEVLQNFGYKHKYFKYDERIPTDTNIIFVQGPYESLVPLISQLGKIPAGIRPKFVYWFQQSLSFYNPDWFSVMLAKTFSDLYHFSGEAPLIGKAAMMVWPNLITNKGARLGFLGDILWLHEHKLLDVLILSSSYYADYLKNHGVPSVVVPRGYHPSYGQILNIKRDIAAVWMGKLRTRRRRNAVHWMKQELEKRGLEMRIFDGEKTDFIFGPERTKILNRTLFVLNIYFSGPTDELSIRFFVAGANGTVTMTEPGLNDYPLIAGEHIIECPIAEMPGRIEYYANNIHEWEKLSSNMFNAMSTELRLDKSISIILDHLNEG